MKRCIVILVIVLVAGIFVSGCRKSIGDRIAEKVTEDMTGADVDISGNGTNVTVETEDGTFSAGENVNWPGESMADLPKPDATIIGVVDNGAQGCSVAFNEMGKADAEQYVESIKALGYTENSMNMADDESIFYMGSAEDGAIATFTYTIESKEGMIVYALATEE